MTPGNSTPPHPDPHRDPHPDPRPAVWSGPAVWVGSRVGAGTLDGRPADDAPQGPTASGTGGSTGSTGSTGLAGPAGRPGERGSASIEAVLMSVALGLVVALVVLGGRVELAKQAVQSAAYDAARSASISRTAVLARSTGVSAGRTSLSEQGVHCSRSTVRVDAAAFDTPLGTVGSRALVSATVSCVLDVSGLGLPGLRTRTITETMTSPLDAYRGR